ncbi:MAG: hypothetical protein J6J43_00355 [Oscillospiraceae bacterium]|nr:hypothetical protein [Oscillospiraceae bacterium]
MASEYYKKKFKDVKPDVPYEMTKIEKWNNWWNYHWFHVLVAVGAVVLICIILSQWVFKTRPDYKIAYVGEQYLMVDAEQLQEQLAALGTDLNGDGKVVVQLRSYNISEQNPYYESDMVGFMGDASVGGSAIFIMEDPSLLFDRYHIIEEENCYLWSECPALSSIDLGGDYTIGICTAVLEAYEQGEENAAILWNVMTAGAE